jgi:hypothetical protein
VRIGVELADTTCAVVRENVTAGFRIVTTMTRLDTGAVEEFLKVYRGVVTDFNDVVKEIASGPSLALEITKGENAIAEFRETCGRNRSEGRLEKMQSSMRGTAPTWRRTRSLRLSTSSFFWNKEKKIRLRVGKTRNAKLAMSQQNRSKSESDLTVRGERIKIASRSKIKEANRKEIKTRVKIGETNKKCKASDVMKKGNWN